MPLSAGETIGGRYRLERRIGSGGMADVWLAADSMLEREVALKFLHERFEQDDQFVERFRREAQSAAGLQHPNVVGVYDRGEHEGRHWIAMEYVEGATLKELIDRGMTIPQAVEIVRQILAGVRFSHEHGIVHRDLKPQNVLVDATGRARVADFGIARAGASEITQVGSVLGTAQYLSPEQAQGLDVTPASDLYSIGVILFECLTGQVPFDGESAVAVAMRQVTEPPMPPSRLNPAVSPALDAVVIGALAKDPAARFRSAAEFSSALDAAARDTAAPIDTGVPLYPMPPPPPEPESWWTTRRVIAALVLLALLIGVAAFALTRKQQVEVPSVVGETQSEAEQIIGDAGLEPVAQTFESCEEPEIVAEQSPTAGKEVDEGSNVRISISLGKQVSVPDVAGRIEAKAKKILTGEDLLASSTTRFSNTVEEGFVIETEPEAGAEVECKTSVQMIVSRGADLVSVPDVVGLQESAARAAIEEAGLIPDSESRDTDEPEGTVVEQVPGPSDVDRNSTVTIYVSTGAGSVVVPDVVGQQRNTAIAALEGRGVTSIEVVRQVTDAPSEDNRVLDQAPGAGSRIRATDTVTIYIGRFEEPEPPPDTTPDTTGEDGTLRASRRDRERRPR